MRDPEAESCETAIKEEEDDMEYDEEDMEIDGYRNLTPTP